MLAYVTGDRGGLITGISNDQVVRFPRHLEKIGKQETLAVMLYTRGGETHTVWPIVNFLREHCDRLTVLVPFYAHSAGTLLALGADRILMSKYGTLSPIDPTVANAFNPIDPMNQKTRLPIAVEDVMAYFKLSKNQGRNNSAARAEAFSKLAQEVHPLALGNVQRSVDQIRELARKMMELHGSLNKKRSSNLIHRLTTGLYSHYHLIGRREATDIGLPIELPDTQVETMLLRYYAELCSDLHLLEKFSPQDLVRPLSAKPTETSIERAYIEAAETVDAFVTELRIHPPGTVQLQPPVGPQQQPLLQSIGSKVVVEVIKEGWMEKA